MQLRNRNDWKWVSIIKVKNTNYERNYILDDLGRVTSIIDSTFGSHTYTYNNNPIEYDTIHPFLMKTYNEYE